jgi:hypothetical protein
MGWSFVSDRPWLRVTLVWSLRLLLVAHAAWVIQRYLLRPDWAVRYVIDSRTFDFWRQFWLWETPDPVAEGCEIGPIRWGYSITSLVVLLVTDVMLWKRLAGDAHIDRSRRANGAATGGALKT